MGKNLYLLQKMQLAGRPALAAQFVDLFVDPAHRGGSIIMGLYKRLLERARQSQVDLIFATPNAAARELNRKLMGLIDIVELPYRVGLSMPMPSRKVRSLAVNAGTAIGPLLEPYCKEASSPSSIHWNPEGLAHRLSHPDYRYSLHMTDKTLLVASPRRTRGIPFVVACCFLTAEGHNCTSAEMRLLLRSAAAHHTTPLFVYAGVNDRLERLPGLSTQDRLKPPILVQGRLLGEGTSPFSFSRCELLDFDFS